MTERHCLRCGAPYDEGATVCFTCGASIGELETPTQPVRAPRKASVTAEPAPPVEAARAAPDTLAKGPIAVGAASATTEAPTQPSRPLTVGTSYHPVVATAPARAPRRIRWPLVIVALVLVAALVTGGIFEARALLATPPIPATTTYHDPQKRFSFAEPALWTVTARSDGAQVADSTGANTVTISVSAATPGQTASAVADVLATRFGAPTAAVASIAGDQWQQRTITYTGSDGATRVLTLYVDLRAGALYVIQTSSPTSVATSINTLVYQPLLASFTFK